MTVQYCLLGIIFFFTLLFIYGRLKGATTALRVIQPVTTIFILILAASGFALPGHFVPFILFIILGLTFSLVGDCNLIDFDDNTLFLISIGFYWAGLVTYSVMLSLWSDFPVINLVLFLVLALGSALIIGLFLWKGLGNLKVPIIIYILTWCYLLSRSLALPFMGSDFFSSSQAWLIAVGTAIFFLGDVYLSFHQFNERCKQKKRWLDVPLYCVGQSLIALSTSFF